MAISKTVMERNIRAYDENEEWQLPRSGSFYECKNLQR